MAPLRSPGVLSRAALKAALVLLALIAAAGCGISLGAREYRKDLDVSVTRDDAVVFGRVVLVENGREAAAFPGGRSPRFRLFHVEFEEYTSELYTWEDGRFAFKVPVGTYVIPEMDLGYRIRPKMALQAPYGADAYYVGTLVVDAATETDGSGMARLVKVNGIRVEDRAGAEVPVFQKNDPNNLSGIWVGLMKNIPEIQDPPARQTRKALAGPLAAAGMAPLADLR